MGSQSWAPGIILSSYSCGEQMMAHPALLEEAPADPAALAAPNTVTWGCLWRKSQTGNHSFGMSGYDLREATKEMMQCGAF